LYQLIQQTESKSTHSSLINKQTQTKSTKAKRSKSQTKSNQICAEREQETYEVCVRAPIPTSMAAAAMDLEEEDTATVLFSQNACVGFHFSERVFVFNVRDVKRVFLFSIFPFFSLFSPGKCPGWPGSSFAYVWNDLMDAVGPKLGCLSLKKIM
jgi:hypothetical protein